MNARIGARPFLALSRLGLARAMVARGSPGDQPAARALAAAAAAELRRLDLPGPLATATPCSPASTPPLARLTRCHPGNRR